MDYDVCIIGAGPAGYAGALAAAREGLKVALVERGRVGGTCLNRGCIPTKALRRSADALLDARDLARFGVSAGDPSLDFEAVAAHRDRTVEELVSGVEALIKARKVTVLAGDGVLAGRGRVMVVGGGGSKEVSAKDVIVATGSRPSDLPGIVIDERRVLSSEGALKLRRVPASLTVIGGGVIGCELADMMATFGSRVAVIEVLPRILANEDRQTARAVQKALESRCVEFRLGVSLESVEAAEDRVVCRLAGGEEVLSELVIVSVGRRSAGEGLGLAEAGVAVEGGRVLVDSRGRAADGVWACGDVIGPPMLAHAATHEMEVVMTNVLGKKREFDRRIIPSVVFTRPEVASVGLLEDAAKEKGIEVEVGRFAYAASGKARCMGETEGMAKVVAEPGGGLLLGASIMGAHAGEMIHEISVAMKGGLSARDFMEVVHAHPTLSEIVLEAVADTMGMATHKAGRRR